MELSFLTKDRNIENLTEWMGAPPPTDVKITFEKESSVLKTTAIAQGPVDFRQRHEFDDDFQYFIAVKGSNNKLICKPAKLLRMMPCFNKFMSQFQDDKEQLSRREQLDELKTKFGSKKTQRQNAQKRKYEIQFGEEDAEALPSLNSNNNNDESNPTSPGDVTKDNIKQEEVEDKVLTEILPKRNVGASRIEEVYNFRDMITDQEYDDISLNREKLSEQIKCDFIKRLCEKADNEFIIMSIYADILIQLLKLSAHDMKKDDPMPHIESDIKKYIFERYTTTEMIGRRMRYVITSVNKDRINAYAIIILFILSKFKPIDMEILKNNFKYPLAKLRRLLEVIGAYFETSTTANKGASIKVAKLKLPLNMPKENNKKFKR